MENETASQHMVVNIDVIHDAHAQGGKDVIHDILRLAECTVKAGKSVTIQQEYINAAPTVLEILTTVEDVNLWSKKLDALLSS